MDYLRQIENDLRNIGNESIKFKKKYPEVSDSAERAMNALKSMREVYVAEIMKKNTSAKLSQSSDILAPYILVCNYAEGSTDIITMALNGINLLLTHDLIPTSEAQNIMRVLNIQMSGSKSDVVQLKILQVLLLMAYSFIRKTETSEHISESVICGFLTLSLQPCENSNISISSTALGTARQIIALVMDRVVSLVNMEERQESNLQVGNGYNIDHFTLSAITLVRELCMFMQGQQSGNWLQGITISPTVAMDLLLEILIGWKHLFLYSPSFQQLLREAICPSLKPLLKGLQSNYVHISTQNSIAAATIFTNRVIKLARCILLNFVISTELYAETELIVALLLHSLQPDRTVTPGSVGGSSTAGINKISNLYFNNSNSSNSGFESGSIPTGGNDENIDHWSSSNAANATTTSSSLASLLMQTSSGVGAALLSRFTAATTTASNGNNNNNNTVASGNTNSNNNNNSSNSTAAGNGVKSTSLSNTTGNNLLLASPGFYIALAGSSSSSSLSATASPSSASTAAASSSSNLLLLPAYPAVCCLETLFSFMMSDNLAELLVQQQQSATNTSSVSNNNLVSLPSTGLHLFHMLMITINASLSNFLQSAVVIEGNLR